MDYLAAPDRIATERFVLRSYEAEDGPLLREATTSSYDHLAPWMPWAVRDQTPREAEQLVRSFRGRYLLAQDFVLGIFAPGGEELWGGAGFHLREGGLEVASAEMGMWVRASRAGQGLGTEVLRALLAWGFEEWPWQRLVWRCDAQNHASRRIAEKVGMQAEGVQRSHMLDPRGARRDTASYAALRGEWTPC